MYRPLRVVLAALDLLFPTYLMAQAPGYRNNLTDVVVLPNDPAILFSPANWSITASAASSPNAGAYFRTMFTGTSATLTFDVSNNKAPLSEIYYQVDGYNAGAPWVRASVAASIPVKMPADTATASYHLLEVVVKSTSETLNRWLIPSDTAVTFTGLMLRNGASAQAPAARPKRVWFFGDSITEGVRTVNSTAVDDTDRNDGLATWTWNVGTALNAEFAIVGFGGSGLLKNGSGNVPPLGISLHLIMAGVPRSFSVAPDMIVLNEGTNDAGADPAIFQSAMQRVLTSLLTLTPATTRIAVLGTFGGYQVTSTRAAIAAIGSPRVTFVSTAGFFSAKYGVDETLLHPTAANGIGQIAPNVAAALMPILWSTSSVFVSH